MISRRSVAAVTGAILIAAAAVIVASMGADASTPSHRPASALIRRFHVLRQARIATVTLPPQLATEIANGPFNLDPTAAQMVTVSGTSVWVIPGSDGVCLRVPRIAVTGATVYRGGCASTARADAGALRDRLGPLNGQDLIFGLAPDGTSTEAVNGPSGASVTTPVVDNVYAVTMPDTSGG
jgi:hypothetical protein